ncbi:MAG: hypothetical protein ABSD46_12095 [Bacteroidota bacterium]
MKPKERFDACMQQAEYAAGRHDTRREVEWKVSLGFWSVLIGAIGVSKLGHPVSLDWWIGPALIFFYAFVWLRGVHVANESDKCLADHFRTEAQDILLNEQHVVIFPPEKLSGWRWCFGFLFKWAMLFHLITTIILVYLVYKLTA